MCVCVICVSWAFRLVVLCLFWPYRLNLCELAGDSLPVSKGLLLSRVHSGGLIFASFGSGMDPHDPPISTHLYSRLLFSFFLGGVPAKIGQPPAKLPFSTPCFQFFSTQLRTVPRVSPQEVQENGWVVIYGKVYNVHERLVRQVETSTSATLGCASQRLIPTRSPSSALLPFFGGGFPY